MNTDIIKAVTEIIKNIQTNGDSAVLDYLKKFDGVEFKLAKSLRVSNKQIKEAIKKLPVRYREIIEARFYQDKKLKDLSARIICPL